MAEDKSIIRVEKNKDNPYTMMNITFTNDERISWKAKGLHAYFLGKPDNWKIMICDLIKKSTDGRDSVYAGLKELINYGYVVRNELREKGRIKGVEYVVYEISMLSPITEIPDTVKPETDKTDTEIPEIEKPNTENQPLPNINKSLPSIDNQSVSLDEQTDLQNIIDKCELDIFGERVKETFEGIIMQIYFAEKIKVGDSILPQAIIRKQLQKLDAIVIQNVLNKLDKAPEKVSNSTKYIGAVLFNELHERYSDTLL